MSAQEHTVPICKMGIVIILLLTTSRFIVMVKGDEAFVESSENMGPKLQMWLCVCGEGAFLRATLLRFFTLRLP